MQRGGLRMDANSDSPAERDQLPSTFGHLLVRPSIGRGMGALPFDQCVSMTIDQDLILT